MFKGENRVLWLTNLIVVIANLLIVGGFSIYSDYKQEKSNANITKIITDTNTNIANMQTASDEGIAKYQRELDKFKMLLDFSTILSDNPNTMATYLAINVAYENFSDPEITDALKEMQKEVDTFAESQIKRHAVDLFNTYSELRADSIAKILDSLSERNLKSFLNICQKEIKFRLKPGNSYTDNYSLEKGIISILHILSCQSDNAIEYEDNATYLNDFLNKNRDILSGGYNNARYQQLKETVEKAMQKQIN